MVRPLERFKEPQGLISSRNTSCNTSNAWPSLRTCTHLYLSILTVACSSCIRSPNQIRKYFLARTTTGGATVEIVDDAMIRIPTTDKAGQPWKGPRPHATRVRRAGRRRSSGMPTEVMWFQCLCTMEGGRASTNRRIR